MLFYLDPPYFGCETDYGDEVFSRGDFELLARQLGSARSKFILSINDQPEVREIFKAFAIRPIETTYSISTASSGSSKRASELIISNFALEEGQRAIVA